MQAVVYHQYGSPDVLQLKEIDKPIPKHNEVLIKIHAASVNSWDWDLLRGKPILFRLIFGIWKPKLKILGADIAGRVEGVGKNVRRFKSGDDVLGDISGSGWGGFATYVCVAEDVLATKPPRMSFEQAAAIPQAAVLALQGLRDKGKIKKGERVLINGAGGGVGTFAVQIAKSFGAEVTGVDCTKKLEMLRTIGADHVIDYTKEDFTRNGEHYDLILDVMAHRSIFDYKRALSSNGRYVMVGGSITRIFQLMFLAPWVSMIGHKRMGILAHKPNRNDLDFITMLFESGKVVPVIDKCYPLSKVGEGIQYLGEGHAKGKVVITIAS